MEHSRLDDDAWDWFKPSSVLASRTKSRIGGGAPLNPPTASSATTIPHHASLVHLIPSADDQSVSIDVVDQFLSSGPPEASDVDAPHGGDRSQRKPPKGWSSKTRKKIRKYGGSVRRRRGSSTRKMSSEGEPAGAPHDGLLHPSEEHSSGSPSLTPPSLSPYSSSLVDSSESDSEAKSDVSRGRTLSTSPGDKSSAHGDGSSRRRRPRGRSTSRKSTKRKSHPKHRRHRRHHDAALKTISADELCTTAPSNTSTSNKDDASLQRPNITVALVVPPQPSTHEEMAPTTIEAHIPLARSLPRKSNQKPQHAGSKTDEEGNRKTRVAENELPSGSVVLAAWSDDEEDDEEDDVKSEEKLEDIAVKIEDSVGGGSVVLAAWSDDDEEEEEEEDDDVKNEVNLGDITVEIEDNVGGGSVVLAAWSDDEDGAVSVDSTSQQDLPIGPPSNATVDRMRNDVINDGLPSSLPDDESDDTEKSLSRGQGGEVMLSAWSSVGSSLIVEDNNVVDGTGGEKTHTCEEEKQSSLATTKSPVIDDGRDTIEIGLEKSYVAKSDQLQSLSSRNRDWLKQWEFGSASKEGNGEASSGTSSSDDGDSYTSSISSGLGSDFEEGLGMEFFDLCNAQDKFDRFIGNLEAREEREGAVSDLLGERLRQKRVHQALVQSDHLPVRVDLESAKGQGAMILMTPHRRKSPKINRDQQYLQLKRIQSHPYGMVKPAVPSESSKEAPGRKESGSASTLGLPMDSAGAMGTLRSASSSTNSTRKKRTLHLRKKLRGKNQKQSLGSTYDPSKEPMAYWVRSKLQQASSSTGGRKLRGKVVLDVVLANVLILGKYPAGCRLMCGVEMLGTTFRCKWPIFDAAKRMHAMFTNCTFPFLEKRVKVSLWAFNPPRAEDGNPSMRVLDGSDKQCKLVGEAVVDLSSLWSGSSLAVEQISLVPPTEATDKGVTSESDHSIGIARCKMFFQALSHKAQRGMLTYHGIPYVLYFPFRVDVGDLVLCKNGADTSRVDIISWDGIGVVVKQRGEMSLFEAGVDGMRVSLLGPRVEQLMQSKRVGLRRLLLPRTREMKTALKGYMTEVARRPYNHEMMARIHHRCDGPSAQLRREQTSKMVTSLVITALFQAIGLLPSTMESNDLVPLHLTHGNGSLKIDELDASDSIIEALKCIDECLQEAIVLPRWKE